MSAGVSMVNRFATVFGSFTFAGLVSLAGCGGTEIQPDPHTRPTCDQSGHACNFVGIPGEVGFNGDGLDRLDTLLYWTMDLQFAADGSPVFIDWNNHIVRRINADQTVTTLVGWNDPIFPGDGDQAHPMAERSPEGAVGTDVQLNHPTDLLPQADGSILLMAWHDHKVRRFDPTTGQTWIVYGNGAGFAGDGKPAAAAALFKQPSHFAQDQQQSLYIIDQQNQRVRKIDGHNGVISTIVGTGTKGYEGDNGPAIKAQLNFQVGDNPEPSGGLVYRSNKLYIADTDNNRIRLVDLETHIITTIAGTGEAGYAGDNGLATLALFNGPRDLEFGPEGDLYVADTDNSRIRAINLRTNLVRTVVGTGAFGLDTTDDLLATDTQLNRPFGIDFDPQGNLYVSDSLNSRILRVAR